MSFGDRESKIIITIITCSDKRHQGNEQDANNENKKYKNILGTEVFFIFTLTDEER